MSSKADNRDMFAGDCARWLGWGDSRAAAKRLTKRIKAREKKAGKQWFKRDGRGALILTKRGIHEHCPDLLQAEFARTTRVVSEELQQIQARLGRIVDRRIERHPTILRHTRKLEDHEGQLDELADLLRTATSAIGQLVDTAESDAG